MKGTLKEVAVVVTIIAGAVIFSGLVESGSVRDSIIRLCGVGLFALSLNLLVGYTGLLSFGHAMFFGLGAYTFAILLRTTGFGIPLAAACSIALSGAVAAVVGAICVRLTHVYFAFLTLAIQMLFYSLLIACSGLTGGEQGLIGGIPRPKFLGVDLMQPGEYFVFNIAIFVAAAWALWRIVRSPFGAALRMIRDNPQRAVFLGVDVYRTKLAAFVLASAFAAIAGMLTALYVSGAYPNFAFWTMSGEGLFMIMLGGVNGFAGPVVGAGLLLLLDTVVNAYTAHRGLFLGLAILVTSLGLRKGVVDFVRDASDGRFASERTGGRSKERASGAQSGLHEAAIQQSNTEGV
ncbi:branched-chain amino acid ABC transporter permease [Bradyrhizobium tropiciagri]|uniref:branched-chain amino acid ABC transporter permease n=1 Tax=Bradyrhizobium tropiciagri TaxID=312253 RepID=UPI000AACC7B9|nr:branched-chain amino acid ABC transporter permease [Bradyrhizobium tropiciagri]